jgi:hypothetical protein
MTIEESIFLIRGHRVMLDRDLANLYEVKTIRLREQVKRNRSRFPADFMFQLTKVESEFLVSQNAIPSRHSFGGSLPYVFTQEGVAMLSSILRSKRAVQMNIAIMRAFGRLREMALTHKELSQRLTDLERGYLAHDSQIKEVFEALHELLDQPEKPPKPIGFKR